MAGAPKAQASLRPGWLLHQRLLQPDAAPNVRPLHEEQLPVHLLLPPAPGVELVAVCIEDPRVLGIQERVRIQELLDHHGQGLRAVPELQLNVPARANAQVSLLIEHLGIGLLHSRTIVHDTIGPMLNVVMLMSVSQKVQGVTCLLHVMHFLTGHLQLGLFLQ